MAPVITSPTTGNLQSFTFEDLMFWAQRKAEDSGSKFSDYANYVALHYGVGEEQAMLDFLEPKTPTDYGIKATRMADGTYSGYIFNNPSEVVTSNPINSNTGTTARATFREMVGQKFNDVEGTLVRNMTRYPSAGGLGQKASYVLGSIGSAVGAVSTGVWLGKTIDSALYNANPEFWNNIGLSSLDPATWSGLTNGSDSPFAGLLNFILGIDPDTGTAQMYMNQDALAYMAYCMNQAGVFAQGVTQTISYPQNMSGLYRVTLPIPYAVAGNSIFKIREDDPLYRADGWRVTSASDTVYCCCVIYKFTPSATSYTVAGPPVFFSRSPFTVSWCYYTRYSSGTNKSRNADRKVINGNTFYLAWSNMDGQGYPYSTYPTAYAGFPIYKYDFSSTIWADSIAYIVLYGTSETSTAIEGIGDQTGATLPDTTGWDTPADTLTSLQQQYPDAFNNAMTWDNYADDGTPAQTTWIPVPFPNTTFANDTQPTSGTQTQTSINISDLPETLIKVITEIVQQTQTETEPKPATPPQNPVDTGTGEPPVLVPPSGSASALWSVYHPTPQQINDFGAWLWTDNVIEQFLRLMNNPMEGIISLHKVYAMPVDASTATIVVGRLDSNVPSATVTQQYVYVDCGTVQLNEQFVNVFDYQPFTSVSLYLPFIGIVPLDVGDVMRASIHIKYGVDVFTGACLAMVEVIRDGNTVNMYQYTGVASVSYPLTGAQNSGLLSGLLGVAAGIGTIAATGNPMGLGMAVSGAVSASRVNMGRSGGFSGNAGAMGIKIPYLIITRPQTMVAQTFPNQQGYPTNYSATLGSYTGFVQCRALHVEGVPATQTELNEIRSLLESGVMV